MLGLMQDYPLTIETILRRGETYAPRQTISTRQHNGIERMTFADLARNARRLAGGLDQLGISADARVGSFGWNSARHLELYFGVPMSGRVLHTINLRYFAEHVVYTVTHAEDEAIFVDRSLLPLFAPYLPLIGAVKHVVVLDDGTGTDMPDDPRIVRLDELLEGVGELDVSGRVTDERTAAALCYTTGTTGNPKGVLYSHRSIWLHANAGVAAAGTAITDRDNVMPIVPMFHAMAWGLPYTAVLAGAGMTMPGADLSPKGLLDLMESEGVTFASGVPTLWMGMLPHVEGRNLSRLTRIMGGGSSVPRALSEGWRAAIGVPITQAWGMTETSPVGSMATLGKAFDDASDDARADVQATAGRALIGVEMRIVDPESRSELPWDDSAAGELEVRGPWVAERYFRTEDAGEQFTADGWLRTGDIASISELGYMRLVDRTKDLVKSGGEWISSVELENLIMTHPDVLEAAVIAVAHPTWMERPLACVVLKPTVTLSRDQILEYLGERLDKWQVPDDVVFIDAVPKTSVGKFDKKVLRGQFAEYRLPTAIS